MSNKKFQKFIVMLMIFIMIGSTIIFGISAVL
ncbi:MAG TPA: stressosome-associated protein Prli42 [Savagea sp.]